METSRNQLTQEMADHLLLYKSNYIIKRDAVIFLRETFPGTSLTLRVNAYHLAYYPNK